MEYRFSTPGMKLACFDLDHTLLKPKGNKKFAKDANDAVYVYDCIPKKLEELRKDGWKLVIFTNQKKKKKEEVPVKDIFTKVDRMLGKDIDIFISWQNDFYRKPSMGMYDKLIELNGEVKESIYVGDAAGRPNDFSSSDLYFAYNTGMLFNTPEEFFLKKAGKYTVLPVVFPEPIPLLLEIQKDKKLVIMMVGRQASGKSYLTRNLLEDTSGVVISNDITGSIAKSLLVFKKQVENNISPIIVDNTNPSKEARAKFISLLKNTNYDVIAIHCKMPDHNCRHLDFYRAYKKKNRCIPAVAFNIFNKHYVEPTIEEGFTTILPYIPKIPEKIMNLHFV